jgi:hypothetical protein
MGAAPPQAAGRAGLCRPLRTPVAGSIGPHPTDPCPVLTGSDRRCPDLSSCRSFFGGATLAIRSDSPFGIPAAAARTFDNRIRIKLRPLGVISEHHHRFRPFRGKRSLRTRSVHARTYDVPSIQRFWCTMRREKLRSHTKKRKKAETAEASVGGCRLVRRAPALPGRRAIRRAHVGARHASPGLAAVLALPIGTLFGPGLPVGTQGSRP